MANTRYPLGLKAIMDGNIDIESDTLAMQLYSGAAGYDPAHEFVSDLTGDPEGSPVTLTGKDTTDGKLTATVGAFTPPASVIVAIVLYVDSGLDSTSRLLAWIDQRADGTALQMTVDGTSFILNWNGPIYSFGGL